MIAYSVMLSRNADILSGSFSAQFINNVMQLLHVIASEQSERSNLKGDIATAMPPNDWTRFELNKRPYL